MSTTDGPGEGSVRPEDPRSSRQQLHLCPTHHPVGYSVDYPDRPLNRLTSALRIFTALPILVVAGAVGGGSYAAGGVLFLGRC